MGSLLEEARKLVKVSVGEESGGYMNAVDVIGATASAAGRFTTTPPVGGAKTFSPSATTNRFKVSSPGAGKPGVGKPDATKTQSRFQTKNASKPDAKQTKKIDLKKAPARARKQLLVDASKARKKAVKTAKSAIQKGLRFQPKLTKVQGAVVLGAAMAAAVRPVTTSTFTAANRRRPNMAATLRKPVGFDDIRNPRQVIVSPMGSPKSDVFDSVDKVIVFLGAGKRWTPWGTKDHMYERPARMTVYVRGGQAKTYTNANTASVFGGVVAQLVNVKGDDVCGDYYEIAGDVVGVVGRGGKAPRPVSPLAKLTAAQKAKMTPKQRAKYQKYEAATNRMNAAAVALVKSGQDLLKKSNTTKKLIQEQGKKIHAMRKGKTVMAGDYYEIQGDVIGDDGLWEIENAPSLMDSVRGDETVGFSLFRRKKTSAPTAASRRGSTFTAPVKFGKGLAPNLAKLRGERVSPLSADDEPLDPYPPAPPPLDPYPPPPPEDPPLPPFDRGLMPKMRSFRINGEIVGEVPQPPSNAHVDHDYDVVGDVPEPPSNAHVDGEYDVVGEAAFGDQGQPARPSRQNLSAVCRCPSCKSPLGLVVQPQVKTSLMGCDFISGTCCAADDVGALMNPGPEVKSKPVAASVAFPGIACLTTCPKCGTGLKVSIALSNATLLSKGLVPTTPSKRIRSDVPPPTVSGDEWEIENEDPTLSEELANMRGGGETIGADAQGRSPGDPGYNDKTDPNSWNYEGGGNTGGDEEYSLDEGPGSPDPNSDNYEPELDPLVNPDSNPIKTPPQALSAPISNFPVDGIKYEGINGWPAEQFGSYSYFFGPKEVSGKNNGEPAFGMIWGWGANHRDRWILRHGQSWDGNANWDDLKVLAGDASQASAMSIEGKKQGGGSGGKGITAEQYAKQNYTGPVYGPLIGNPKGQFANLRWAINDKCWFWYPSEAPDWATAEIKRAAELIKREKEKLEYEEEMTRRKEAKLIKDAEDAERARIDFETEMKYKQEDADAAVAKSQQERQDAATQSALDEAQFRLEQQAQQQQLELMRAQQEFQLQAAQQQMQLQAQAQQMQLDFLKQQGLPPIDTSQYGQFALDEFGNPIDQSQTEEYAEEYVDERGVPTPRTRTTDEDRLPPPDMNALPIVDEADYDAAMEAYNESAE